MEGSIDEWMAWLYDSTSKQMNGGQMLNRQMNDWMDGWMINGYIGLMALSMDEQTKNN